MKCECDKPGYCKKAGQNIMGRMWEICQGVNISEELQKKYQELWTITRLPEAMDKFSTCKFKKEQVKELVECNSCNGRVMLKQFKCDKKGLTTKKQCDSCEEYQPTLSGE